MPIDLLDDNATNPQLIDLLADEPDNQSFEDLSPDEQVKVMELARQKISAQHPDMPDWVRDLILNVTPRDQSPMLESAARGVSNVTNKIPAVAGGLLQGASLPIRGAASLIPSEFTQRLANSPDLSGVFKTPESEGDQYFNLAGQLLGAGGPLAKMVQGLGKGAALSKVPKALQTPLALGGTGALVTQGNAKERALGAGGALALGGLGKVAGKAAKATANKLPEFMRGLTTKSTPESLVEAVQKPHDILQSTADELYGQVRSAVKKRNIKIPVKDEHLNQIEEILPKTRASKKLIESARSGDYQAVHDLQSHLYQKGTKGLASDDIALENQGEEILDLRDKINDDFEKQLLKEGHTDIAHVLRQGKKTVAQLKKTYYAPHLRKGIGKMVQKDLRLIPENPEKLFNQNSVPMKEFLSKHPEVAKHAQGIREKEATRSALRKVLLGTGAGGATITGSKILYDLLK